MKRYHVTTFGCQMNAHDSERIKGMLEELGLGEAVSQGEADVIVFNTCTIREKPDQRFAAHLGNAKMLKLADPEKVIAVGGCYAEAQRERLFELYPFVDVAFGPGSIPHLGEWLGTGGQAPRSRFGTGETRAFAGTLPMRRERRFQAWVQVSMGCNSVCSYCIVPAVRGREVSRRPGEIVAEVTRLAGDGVREITLLGQNVNSWGRDLLPDVKTEFGELLRACDAVSGIERIRFTSPHPKDFRREVIAAMAECEAVCEHAHLPLRLLTPAGDGGGDDARAGSGGGQAGADRAPRGGRSAQRARAQPGADRPSRGSAGRRGEPHRLDAPARPDAPQHHGQLRRDDGAGRTGGREDRGRDLDHPPGHRAGRCCSVVATCAGTGVSTSATSEATEPRTAPRRASARSSGRTACASCPLRAGRRPSTTASALSSTCGGITSARATHPPSLPWRCCT